MKDVGLDQTTPGALGGSGQTGGKPDSNADKQEEMLAETRRLSGTEPGPAGCTAWRGPWQGPVGCTRGDVTQERGRKGRNAAEQNTSPSLGLPVRGGGKDGTCPRRSPAASFQKADNLSPSNMGGDSRTKNCPLEKRFVVSRALAKNISLLDAPNSPLTWVSSQISDEETEAQTGRGGAQQIHMLGD